MLDESLSKLKQAQFEIKHIDEFRKNISIIKRDLDQIRRDENHSFKHIIDQERFLQINRNIIDKEFKDSMR